MFISVCLATYNGEAFITDQLKSILSQIGEGDEVIISDDFSTDRTCEIIRAFNDSRIILIENNTRMGVIKNFEQSLKRATGKYIFLSDQDDVWVDGKVKVILQYLKSYSVVLSDAVIVDSNLKELYPSYFKLTGAKPGLIKNFWRNNYIGCNMAFHREVLNIALPFPTDIPMHDQWIGIIGELFFKTFFIPHRLCFYRRHNSNSSTTGFKSRTTFRQKIKFRINLLKYFPLLIKRKLAHA